MKKLSTGLLRTQGFYMLVTGIWALIDIGSFMRITGPKTDIWLVYTFSLVLICIALSLIHASIRRPSFSIYLLAFNTALVLLTIDLYYPLNGTISNIYIADGFAQMVFMLGWLNIFYRMLRLKKRWQYRTLKAKEPENQENI